MLQRLIYVIGLSNNKELNPENQINLAFVGKYLDLLDAYKSLIEAIKHAGITHQS